MACALCRTPGPAHPSLIFMCAGASRPSWRGRSITRWWNWPWRGATISACGAMGCFLSWARSHESVAVSDILARLKADPLAALREVLLDAPSAEIGHDD